MDKHIRKKVIYKIFLIICVFTVVFSSFYFLSGQVLAFRTITEYDRMGGKHEVNAPDAGDAVRVPEDMPQSLGTYEGFDKKWSYTQKKVKDKWVEQGKPASDSHWAYLEVGGEKRYLVALSPVFGVVGDYVDIYLTYKGESKVYPCIMADAKDIWVDNPYIYNGKAYGHTSNGKCNIIEVCSELPSRESYYSQLSPLLNKLSGVTQIVNGGNMFEHPDGPVGLEGPYNYEDGSVSDDGKSSKKSDETSTIGGVIIMMLRNICDNLCVTFENHIQSASNMTVLYDIKDLDNEGQQQNSNSSTSTDGFIQYYQGDYANVPYGSSNLAKCGCGPTSFAMVATHISGREITPADAIAWCGNSYYVSGAGTSWTYFSAAARHFNLNCTVTTSISIDEVANALHSGALVISSQRRGLFTNGGHYIVLSGIDSDDNITVKDPNKNNAVNKGYNNRKFTKSEINASAKNYWIFRY